MVRPRTMSAELDRVAFRFFKLFAQYEYALKAMGFGSAGSNGQAEPSWDRFANDVGVQVMAVNDGPVADARRYILEQPPKRQVWVEGRVDWEPVANTDRSVQALFGHIRRVRNNLYHGGKFNGRWFDPDRSRELIEKALLVLDELKNLDSRLGDAIQGNAGGPAASIGNRAVEHGAAAEGLRSSGNPQPSGKRLGEERQEHSNGLSS